MGNGIVVRGCAPNRQRLFKPSESKYPNPGVTDEIFVAETSGNYRKWGKMFFKLETKKIKLIRTV